MKTATKNNLQDITETYTAHAYFGNKRFEREIGLDAKKDAKWFAEIERDDMRGDYDAIQRNLKNTEKRIARLADRIMPITR